jgi:hypothetical protein
MATAASTPPAIMTAQFIAAEGHNQAPRWSATNFGPRLSKKAAESNGCRSYASGILAFAPAPGRSNARTM